MLDHDPLRWWSTINVSQDPDKSVSVDMHCQVIQVVTLGSCDKDFQ